MDKTGADSDGINRNADRYFVSKTTSKILPVINIWRKKEYRNVTSFTADLRIFHSQHNLHPTPVLLFAVVNIEDPSEEKMLFCILTLEYFETLLLNCSIV